MHSAKKRPKGKDFLKGSEALLPSQSPSTASPTNSGRGKSLLRCILYVVLAAIPIRLIFPSSNNNSVGLQSNNNNKTNPVDAAAEDPKQGEESAAKASDPPGKELIEVEPKDPEATEPIHQAQPIQKQLPGEWLPISHEVDGFPGDIVCQRLPDINTQTKYNCQRYCSNAEQRNMIVHPFSNSAGLGDRESILTSLVDLAGYLCATVFVPRPALLLDSKHNAGQGLYSSLKWSDFVDFHFHNKPGLVAVGDVTMPEFENSFQKWIERYHQRNHPERWTILQTQQPGTVAQHFRQALDLSGAYNKGFIWVLYPSWYALRDPLTQYLEQQQQVVEELHLPLAFWQNSYSYHTLPSKLQQIVQQLWDETVWSYSSQVVGSWHIRRNDAKSECDTSLPRMERFIQCTFAATTTTEPPQKITLLLQTDERDPNFTQQLEALFAQHANHVQVLKVDDLVRKRLQELVSAETIPKTYLNNFHVFQVVRGLVAKGQAFQLKHRRKFECPDCVPNLLGNTVGNN